MSGNTTRYWMTEGNAMILVIEGEQTIPMLEQLMRDMEREGLAPASDDSEGDTDD